MSNPMTDAILPIPGTNEVLRLTYPEGYLTEREALCVLEVARVVSASRDMGGALAASIIESVGYLESSGAKRSSEDWLQAAGMSTVLAARVAEERLAAALADRASFPEPEMVESQP